MDASTSARPDRRPAIGLALALVLECALLAADVLTHSVVLTTTFLAVPLALALVAAPRTVAVTAALSVLLAFLSGVWNEYFLTADHTLRVSVVIVAGTLAVISALARQRAVEARAETDAASRVADASRRRLDAILGALAEAVTVHDERGKTIYANEAAVRLLGAHGRAEILAAEPGDLAARFDITHEDGSPVRVDDLPGRRVVLGEQSEPMLTRSVERATGRAYWLLTKATVVTDSDGGTLAVNVIEDVTAVKEAERRQRFLAEAGQLLASSLNYAQTLERVAQLAVPVLADWCAVDLLNERGELERVALTHPDPHKVELGKRLQKLYPPELDEEVGIGAVLRTGVAELYAKIGDDVIAEAAVDEQHLAMIRELGMRSAILAPMRVGERTIGVMTLVTADSARSLGADDLVFAEDIALRAAVAVENARLYTELARTAETLQDSLLPRRLPELESFRAAVSYRAGDSASDVGGDFYDLFGVEGGVMVVLGDVTGRGVEAAAVTALVRHSAKTAARFDPRPGVVLDVVNEALRAEPGLTLVTVVCARLQETDDGAVVDIACGGHPLPLLLDRASEVSAVGRGGVVLGAVAEATWPEQRLVLAPGETLLFYTDGAIEARGTSERFGDQRLAELLATGDGDPQAIVERIDQALERFQRAVDDDRAMLAIQYVGAGVSAGRRR